MPFEPGRVRALLFDLDGTLADTDDQYIAKAERLLRPVRFLFPQGNPKPFLRWALMAAEPPINGLMWLPDWLGIDGHLVNWMNHFEDWRGRKRVEGHFVLMDGVGGLLPALQPRYPLALVTARPARGTQAFLTQFNLGPHFAAVASAQTVEYTKPYPHPLRWAAQQLNVPIEQCVMIGDTPVDMLAGQRAGAQTIGVLCGLGTRASLQRAGADLILDHTTDLAQVCA